jgi:hypothetical protein
LTVIITAELGGGPGPKIDRRQMAAFEWDLPVRH